jgi:hypothetical protein
MRVRWPRSTAAGLLLLAGLTPALAQQKQEDKQQEKIAQAQRQEIQALVKIVDAAMAGQPAPTDITGTLQPYFLKALDNKTYVPFTILVDPAKVASPSVAMYIRVAPKGATGPAAPPAEKKDEKKKDDKNAEEPPPYPFEDVHFLELRATAAGQPHRVSRAFAVAAGEYDVYVALKETAPQGGQPQGAQPKSGLVKQTLTVPNYWNGELNTSSVLLADKVEPLTAPIPKEEQAEHPFTLGNTEITPAPDLKFATREELSVIFLVYNPQLTSDKKPDLTVEYNFHQKAADGEKFFNKTDAQAFNSQTLPPQFDVTAGHQIVAGQAVPLAKFPQGDYRLEIKVTDKLSGKSLTRDVNFTVGP